MDYFVFAGSDRPALTMRHEQAADETKCGGVLCKNIPFAEKWQADLKAKGLEPQNEKLAQDYCVCMWDQPLSKLSDEQIRNFGKISPEEQLKLLGGAEAFEARDKQCVADLKAE